MTQLKNLKSGLKKLNFANDSAEYFDAEHICLNEAQKNIAHGALTNSKRLCSFVAGIYPAFFVRAQNEILFDYDDKQFVDYLGALGTNLFGYNNPTINLEMIKAIHQGVLFSLGSPSEVEFSRLFKSKFSYVDKIRILKSGSEGCSAAIRIARTFTGRDHILSEGYHGWHDEFTSLTKPSNGVPRKEDISDFTWEQLLDSSIAAVIVEPVITDFSDFRRQWLMRLRDECTKYGTVLIFDETITGLRFPKLSVAGHWGIEPDITIMGKALANGMAISVVGGKSDIMDSDYFVSSTFAGERVTLEAAITCLKLIGTSEFNIDTLWEYGTEFIERMNNVLNPYITLEGYPTRGIFKGDRFIRSLFFQEMCKLGYFFHPSTWFYNKFLHSHLDDLVDCSSIVLQQILNGAVSLEGNQFYTGFEKKGHSR